MSLYLCHAPSEMCQTIRSASLSLSLFLSARNAINKKRSQSSDAATEKQDQAQLASGGGNSHGCALKGTMALRELAGFLKQSF
jgi:hypothetical protein